MKDPRKSFNSRGTGCQLNRQNLESLIGLWQAAMSGNANAWRDMEMVLDSKSTTSIVLRQYDSAILGMLRNFVQARRLISDELTLRLRELADVEATVWKMLDDPAIGEDEKAELRKLVAAATPPAVPAPTQQPEETPL